MNADIEFVSGAAALISLKRGCRRAGPMIVLWADKERQTMINGSCHCGRIAFTCDDEPTEAITCNCSICRRRGSILHATSPERFRLTTPREALTAYTFNTHRIRHQVCSVCGCAPFAEGRMGEEDFVAVNLRCTDVDLEGLKISPFDGASL